MRFTWRKVRRCETLPVEQTPKGLAAAAHLRDQVVKLEELGLLTDEKYLELFPNTRYVLKQLIPTFGEYSQIWLDSRQIVKSTRDNYKRVLNTYWMPALATDPINEIRSLTIRRIVKDTPWPSVTERRFAINTLSGIMKAAIADELITTNPVASIQRGKVQAKEPDPFTLEEAEQIVDWLYGNLTGAVKIYAAYYEFAFFTGMRPCEILGLARDMTYTDRRKIRVRRVMVDGEIHERVKTKYARDVLLNERALHALERAAEIQGTTSTYVFRPTEGGGEFIASENTPKRYLDMAMEALGIRRRRQYATRHTYATACLMAGMTPMFVAKQLGHSLQVLLEIYARWIDSDSDFLELEKLNLPSARSGSRLGKVY
ncbi:tyrosine-type recombinase/integrase [Pseudomonas sp. Pc102]|uniref:tyrosine-type recombinase/integrase n=1 Tax=Pseudomonas sp. Pc102 TaxID=2678261 RepID=UPI001FD25C5C|nr:tyrosine-type recombinase/integrase [Pseudomonas sp. Pc102]